MRLGRLHATGLQFPLERPGRGLEHGHGVEKARLLEAPLEGQDQLHRGPRDRAAGLPGVLHPLLKTPAPRAQEPRRRKERVAADRFHVVAALVVARPHPACAEVEELLLHHLVERLLHEPLDGLAVRAVGIEDAAAVSSQMRPHDALAERVEGAHAHAAGNAELLQAHLERARGGIVEGQDQDALRGDAAVERHEGRLDRQGGGLARACPGAEQHVAVLRRQEIEEVVLHPVLGEPEAGRGAGARGVPQRPRCGGVGHVLHRILPSCPLLYWSPDRIAERKDGFEASTPCDHVQFRHGKTRAPS